MSIRRAICALFRPKRNVRRKPKWLREYMLAFNSPPVRGINEVRERR